MSEDMVTALAPLREAVRMLGEARSLDAIRHVHAVAAAAEQYAHAERLGDEAEQYAREIRVRAARKAGEKLDELRRAGMLATHAHGRAYQGAARSTVLPADPPPPRLVDLGLDKSVTGRWGRIARVPEDVFERAVADGRGEKAIARMAPRLHVVTEQSAKPKRGRAEPRRERRPTQSQALTMLENVAVQVQAIAVMIDSATLARLYDVPEAQPHFDVIEKELPRAIGVLRRALKERGQQHGSGTSQPAVVRDGAVPQGEALRSHH